MPRSLVPVARPLGRPLGCLLALTLLVGCAAWQDPPGSGDVLSRYEVAGPPPDPPTHVASDVMLRRSGALLYRKGRYKRAVQHVEPLLKKYSRHYLATAYLGLCRWFQGRPEETAALWKAYANPHLPGLGRSLVREAQGLTLLAERLRARRAVYDAGQGRLAPVTEGLVAVLDFAPAPRTTAPDRTASDQMELGQMELSQTGSALAVLTGDVLAGPGHGLRIAPRDRVRAWLTETGAPRGSTAADPLRARGLARLMGAEFAAAGLLRPDPTVPGGLLLELLVLPAEDPPQRRSRIQRHMTRTLERLEAIASEQSTLAGNMAIHAKGLDHFRDLERLDGLLRERDAAKERARSLMEAGDLEAGHAALDALAELQERVESLHTRTRRFRMAAYQAELNLFSVDKAMLEERQARTEDRSRDLRAEAASLEQRRLDLEEQLGRELPPHGVLARVDLPPFMARAWPGMVARAVSRALGRILAAPAPLPVLDETATERVAALGRALAARDAGRWEDSERAFALAGPLAESLLPTAQPPDDFDTDALAGLEEAAMAEALEGRILAIMSREAGSFQVAGGSGAEFDRLAEGR